MAVDPKEFVERFRREDGSFDAEALEAALQELPAWVREPMGPFITKFSNTEINRIRGRMRILELASAEMRDRVEVLDELEPWVRGPIVLERPSGSWLHHVRQALRSRNADGITEGAFLVGEKLNFDLAGFDEALAGANCFIVEHDWARAFSGAADFDSGEIKLPFDVCAFEFQISGRRVVALMTTADEAVLMEIMVRGARRWIIDDDILRHENGRWSPIASGVEKSMFQPLIEFIGSQVRAATIALDAQVAESEVVRVDEKFARVRQKAGRVPPKPYHIISLARRSRVAPRAASAGETEHSRKRLHFRRGHWRHYEDHKTWIRWMLVGDPDLGFVDKEYRL